MSYKKKIIREAFSVLVGQAFLLGIEYVRLHMKKRKKKRKNKTKIKEEI